MAFCGAVQLLPIKYEGGWDLGGHGPATSDTAKAVRPEERQNMEGFATPMTKKSRSCS